MVLVVILGVVAFESYSLVQAHSDINSLRTKIDNAKMVSTSEQRDAASESKALNTLEGEVSGLQTQVGSLSRPTDPLSAYNLVCSSPETNNFSGVTQTYYYPCTNEVQTTPQPGA